jgi:hypothetical protein
VANAEPVWSDEGDTEADAQRVEVTEAVKVAEGVAQAVPEVDAEGDREGLKVKESEAVALCAVENDTPDVTVTPNEALTVVEGDGATVAVWLAELVEPADGVAGTEGVPTPEADLSGVPVAVLHALSEPVCDAESVNELEGEGVMVTESVATAVPEGVPLPVMVPDVDTTAVPVRRGEAEEESVGDLEPTEVTLADSEALPD